MGANSFLSDENFGIISSNTTLIDQVADFFTEGEEPNVKDKKEEEKEIVDEKDGKKKEPELPKKKVLTDDILLADVDKEEEGDEESSEGEEKEPEGDNTFSDLAEELYDLGVFIEDEEGRAEIKTPQEFLDHFVYEKKKGVADVLDGFLNSKGEEARAAFDAIIVNGVPPRNYIEKIADLKDVKDLDMSLESNQEKVVRELMRRENKKDIDGKIEKLRTYGDLGDAAIEAHALIIESDEKALQKQVEDAKATNLRKAQIKADLNNNVIRILNEKIQKKDFDGIPVNRQFAEEINSYMTKEIYSMSTGEKLTTFDKDLLELNKPENYELKVKVAMLLKILPSDPTLSKIGKSAVSKETNTLFKKVAQSQKKIIEKKEPNKPSWFDN